MKILLTNDDGIYSPGLNKLAYKLKEELGEVLVVAPDRERSGVSHSITFIQPIRLFLLKDDKIKFYATTGTPIDCILLALYQLKFKPDVIVSGINRGANLGEDIIYSGTTAAAREGAILGFPGIAVSLDCYNEYPFFETAIRVTLEFLKNICWQYFPHRVYFNINVPNLPWEKLTGVKLTYQGKRVYKNEIEEMKDPWGRPVYWITGAPPKGILEEGSDLAAVSRGEVSITPLQLDYTDYKLLSNQVCKKLFISPRLGEWPIIEIQS